MSTPAVLTPTELKIVKEITMSTSRQDVANLFHISLQTVKVHLRNIYRKTACNDVVDLTHYALSRGWIGLKYELSLEISPTPLGVNELSLTKHATNSY